MTYHLDTDFLVKAVSQAGPHRHKLLKLVDTDALLQMSAWAWYEFSRGPRTPEQLAVARTFFLDDGSVPITENVVIRAAEQFRTLGSPRKRAADIFIGVAAVCFESVLLTDNHRDFAGIEGLVLDPVS